MQIHSADVEDSWRPDYDDIDNSLSEIVRIANLQIEAGMREVDVQSIMEMRKQLVELNNNLHSWARKYSAHPHLPVPYSY